MSTEDDGRLPIDRLAARISSRREEVLRSYERRLEEECVSLVADADLRHQTLAQAVDIFDEVLASLHNSDVGFGASSRELARNIGTMRAVRGEQPQESLRATAEFFKSFIGIALDCLGVEPESSLTRVTLALHRSIMMRTREAAVAYSGFLIDKMRQEQIDQRRALARDLHDLVGATIAVTFRHLELFDAYREIDPAAAEEKIELARQSLTQVLSDIRRLGSELRIFESQYGIEKALREYVNLADVPAVAVNMSFNGNESWISESAREEVFLIIREALSNAFRHASPKAVSIIVEIARHELEAEVVDDGCGFSEEASNSGLGLISMKERVILLGGTFRLVTSPGKGTSVRISVPLGMQGVHG